MESAIAVDERISTLEKRLETMEHLLEERLPSRDEKGKRGWHDIVGTFANDPLYEKAMHSGREWRDSQKDEIEDEI